MVDLRVDVERWTEDAGQVCNDALMQTYAGIRNFGSHRLVASPFQSIGRNALDRVGFSVSNEGLPLWSFKPDACAGAASTLGLFILLFIFPLIASLSFSAGTPTVITQIR